MANDFDDGFCFGESDEEQPVVRESRPEVSRSTPITESSNTELPKNAGNNRVNRRERQAPVTSKKSNALPDPNKIVRPPKRRGSGSQTEQTQTGGTPTEEPRKEQVKQKAVKEKPVKAAKVKKEKPVKKPGGKKKIKVVLGVVGLVAVIGVGGIVVVNSMKQEPMVYDYDASGRKIYDTLEAALNDYKPEDLDKIIGKEDGDSYIAQEWSYANNNSVREDFIKKVCGIVKFSYPTVEQYSTKGEVMTDKEGNPIMIESYMNNGEKVIITIPDYADIAKKITEDKDVIEEMGIMDNIKTTDYDFQDKCFDLMLKYILSLDEIPTTTREVEIPIGGGIVKDDVDLDNMLFASDSYHNMCDEFDKIMTGYTGVTTEKYTEKEEVHNPEYDAWYKIFKERYDADGGKFNKDTSLWEPWYVYDENNQVQYDENGNKLVRYYSVKDENGNDWIQPSKTIWQDVEKTREVPVEYVPEKAVPYCFLGAWYAQNEYDGDVPSEVRVGDGSIDYPAGVGTPIITSVLGKDGKYHDIKVTLLGYWIGEDAIDYSETFSEKNRGFDPKSPVQLICYEIQVDNLEDKAFTFDSEMMLCDKSASKTGRTGTMYGFNYEDISVDAKGSVIFNDWATSTEIEQKYVAWGKSFNREYETVFFKVLAGTGEVPTYSAYKQFTGKSTLEDQKEIETTDVENTEE